MRALAVAFLVAILSASVGVTVSGDPDDELFPNEQQILKNSQTTFDGGVKAGEALNMVAVGTTDLGGRGFNADVFVHRGFAYVGRWGFFDPQHPQFCPTDGGIAVIDVRDPVHPVQVADLRNPGATLEDVVVYTARFGPVAGHDIAVAGAQWCAASRLDPAAAGHRGLQLWDVTNPAAPVALGFLDTGCCTRGVHEFEVGHREDLRRTFAYASVPFSERFDSTSPNLQRDRLGRGDARLFDITDPTKPFEVSTWGIKKDLGIAPGTIGQGCFAVALGHGMTPSEDGKLLFVSYWDAGYIALDVSRPERPRFLGKTTYAANEDGDAHSASYDAARRLLFTADEDFCKTGPGILPGWGFLRVFDVSKPGAPVQIGAFRTEHSLGLADPGAGDFTIHNPLVVGTDVYLSWYTDGIRVVDASDPRNPREVAFFVPPAGHQPIKPAQRNVLTNTTQVWGVAVDGGLVYGSDMNTGLWIVKRTDK